MAKVKIKQGVWENVFWYRAIDSCNYWDCERDSQKKQTVSGRFSDFISLCCRGLDLLLQQSVLIFSRWMRVEETIGIALEF